MSTSAQFTLTLAKEDFKFSCGHFTVFGAEEAELLHGHNYQVAVELTGRDLGDEGLLADFVSVKAAIRRRCARLDSRMLIPTGGSHLEISPSGDHVEVCFGERRYRFPVVDVVLLELVNTSIEAMARMLWEELAEELELPGIDRLGVCVSETAGQSCWYRAPWPASS